LQQSLQNNAPEQQFHQQVQQEHRKGQRQVVSLAVSFQDALLHVGWHRQQPLQQGPGPERTANRQQGQYGVDGQGHRFYQR
jgi:hypothetical protein